MPRPIHTGIIGFGLSGRVFHAPFIYTHPGFELLAVVERHHRHAADTYPVVNILRSHRELLENKDIELIVITTPNTLHFPMAVECLEAGKHIVIEKPFTPTSAEADALIRLSEKTGKKIFVYQNRRWDGDFQTIKNLAENNVLGELRYYEAHFDRFSPEIKPGAWRNENIPGGGILFDLGSHLVDQALVLFGLPDSLIANVNIERAGAEVDDAFHIEMHYPGLKAIVTAGMLVEKAGPRYIVEGSLGKYSKFGIDPQEARLKAGEMPSANIGKEDPSYWGIIEPGQKTSFEPYKIPSHNGNYMAFYDGVFASIRENAPMPVEPLEARNVIFIIEKAFESSKSGRTIKIKKTQ